MGAICMPNIKPFIGYRVCAEQAETVVSPAYDSVSPQQRRAFADANPRNFLNTMRLLEDFTSLARPSPEQLLADNKAKLQQLLTDGAFEPLSRPSLFIYQLKTAAHVQTGVVCEIGVDEYERGLLRKHENTQADKEDLLTAYHKTVAAVSSPISLAYANDADIDACVANLVATPAQLEFTAEDGVLQRIWAVPDAATEDLTALFARIEITYLTDGHHRAASCYRYAQAMRAQHGNRGDEPYNQLFVVLFPDHQLQLLPFHRCVRDGNGLTRTQLCDALRRDFHVAPVPMPDASDYFVPTRAGEFGMYIDNNWYHLTYQSPLATTDPLATLDVVRLHEDILRPILGIRELRDDPRLDYIAGIRGADGIHQKTAAGWAIIFTCYAPSIAQLMQVADAAALMPPKSTYFDPKPRPGIFVLPKNPGPESQI